MPVEMVCDSCGKVSHVSPSRLVGQKHHFCNHACCSEWKRTRKGPEAGGWRGGVVNGDRVKIHAPGHPNANTHGYVYRYRLVAEQMLGRYLLPGEVVHHKDENRKNDDPSNLQVFASEAEHQRHHGLNRGGLNGTSK